MRYFPVIWDQSSAWRKVSKEAVHPEIEIRHRPQSLLEINRSLHVCQILSHYICDSCTVAKDHLLRNIHKIFEINIYNKNIGKHTVNMVHIVPICRTNVKAYLWRDGFPKHLQLAILPAICAKSSVTSLSTEKEKLNKSSAQKKNNTSGQIWA